MQSLVITACQDPKNTPSELRRSQDNLSKSPEIKQQTAKTVCTGVYLDSPCGHRNGKGSSINDELKPLDHSHYSDFPH